MITKKDLEVLLAIRAVQKEKGLVSFGDILEYLGEETEPEDFEEIYEVTEYGKEALKFLEGGSNITIH